MARYDHAVAVFKRQKFCRMMLGAIAGLMCACLMPTSEHTVFVGLYPALILMGMNCFSLRTLIVHGLIIFFGTLSGTLVMEIFESAPVMAAVISYGVFLTVIKLFSIRYNPAGTNSFIFCYSLSTIFSSYPGSTMKFAVTQDYMIQVLLIIFIAWGAFALFPAQMPLPRKAFMPRRQRLGNFRLAVYALVCTGVWSIFMFFEWRVALFAFLSFIGSFCFSERRTLKFAAGENIVIHVICCTLAALFSLLLLGMASNPFVLCMGFVVLVTPVIYRAVYPPRPDLIYRCNNMVVGILVPLVLYLSTNRAAVYQCTTRGLLIILLMAVLWLVVEYIHHAAVWLRKLRIHSGKDGKFRFENA